MAQRLLFVSMTVLFLGYFLYQPLPSDIKQPWKLRIVSLFVDAELAISYLLERTIGKPVAESFDQFAEFSSIIVHHKYPELQVEDTTLEGVPVRVYRPKKLKGPAPCTVFLHGGGWVLSSINFYDYASTHLALQTDTIVVAVKYRTAPKYHYPVPFDDCLKAVSFVLRNGAERLGIDVNRVAIAGDSAGGNLAAAVSLRLSQEHPDAIPRLKLQVLINPVLQAITFNTASYVDNSNWFLKKNHMIFFFACYLGIDPTPETIALMARDRHISPGIRTSIYGSYLKHARSSKIKPSYEFDSTLAAKLDSLVTEPFIAPLMADDLSKVAPAFVVAAEFDVLRDDALLYADRLKKAGVATDLWLAKGHPHCGGAYLVDEILENVSDYIKKHL